MNKVYTFPIDVNTFYSENQYVVWIYSKKSKYTIIKHKIIKQEYDWKIIELLSTLHKSESQHDVQ